MGGPPPWKLPTSVYHSYAMMEGVKVCVNFAVVANRIDAHYIQGLITYRHRGWGHGSYP